jgi:hypothetical protein
MRLGARLVFALAAIGVSGCAMGALPPAQAHVAPMRVGAFTPAPGEATEMDRSVSVRAGVQSAPGGSFATYLGDLLEADLKSAGRFDASSDLVVSGVVTHTHVDSGLPHGHAALGATFHVTRGGVTVLDKALSTNATWDSDFVGAAAIPDALNHYLGLFEQKVRDLAADPDFRAAAHQP